MTDLVRRFIFERRPVRGHWVHLTGAWRDLRAHADYPPAVRELLGQAVAASVLLAATLKFRGTLTFQLQGDGAVNLLVAQCTHDFRLRAVAHFDATAVRGIAADTRRGAVFRQLVGADGRITVTIEADEKSMRYQGVVPLTGTSLAESLESYFASSEQLPTRVLLAADGSRSAGLLVQRLPDADADTAEEAAEAWGMAQRGIESLDGAALLGAPVEQLLAQGFPGSDLRLFRGAAVLFECRCSCGRVAGLLRALGEDEIRDVLKEQGAVTVTCEFCSRPYRFSASDVETLFTEGQADGSVAIH
ncbi:MAG: Hsp33 family molecular chaperone HslO [Steroidobacteraceae bacterium]